MNTSFPVRVKILSGSILLIGLLIVTKLFYVQVVHGQMYTEKANHQYVSPSDDIFDRGSILLTTKDGQQVSGATLTTGYKVAINPAQVTDGNYYYDKLAPYLLGSKEDFFTKVEKKKDPYEEIANRLPEDAADTIASFDLPGVQIYKEKWRTYPGNTLASRTLGFVAYKDDTLTGRYGLERYYDSVLTRGKDGATVNFFAELFSNVTHSIFNSNGDEGDIITSLEPTVEQSLEDTLSTIMSTWHSDLAGGIVMDPKTGEIYAMDALPDFNLNAFGKVTDPSLYANPMVENVYELGSVVKTLTMAAGIDAGVVTPETTYDDKGFLVLNTEKINNFDKKGRGITSMQEVLNQSLNTGAATVMLKLGREKFKDYFLSFKIAEKTGIDMPGEVTSLVKNLNSNRDIEFATASFGQGIALSPISAIRAFSAIANEGRLVTPHLVKEIRYSDGSSKTLKYPESDEVIKPETASTVTQMMTKVVDTALFGGKEKLEHYSIAAKTGTAQIALPGGKGYYEDRFLHSMYGFYPAYDPKFLVLLFTINPKGVDFSANTLGKPFMSLAKSLLYYYGVPPDR